MKKVINLDEITEVFKKENYIHQINRLKKSNGEWMYNQEIIGKKVKELNKEYDQDGTLVYNEYLRELKSKKYPKDVTEKIANELKKMFLVDFYEKEEEKAENNNVSERFKIIQNALEQLSLPEDLFFNSIVDYEDNEIKNFSKKLSTLPIETQKLIVDIGEFAWLNLGNPNKEIVKYALSLGQTSLEYLSKNQRTKDVEMVAAQYGQILKGETIKKLSPKTREIFIKNHPEEIISEINKDNWDTKKLTIYDLNKKELKIYKKALEQKQIELVKKDPTIIRNLENPSSLVRNYAVLSFRKKWER